MNRRYATEHPTLPVHTALAPAGAWCKARAVTPAIAASTADIIVVADADVWTDELAGAIDAVKDGAPWAIPHQRVHRLTRDATSDLIAGRLSGRPDTTERIYRGVMGGGIVVAPRRTLVDVPFDARFVGWGQEDAALGVALHVLAGPAWRGTADLIHLWHPPQERLNRKIGSVEGQRLHRRYIAARRDADAMRALIEEGRP